ncbi:restriction endonuclease subunit S [Moraxella nonliquefaciens]|uniref:restriction endonuclease subunit S n=1 Tax=Moraxella nonliquefaciens TaxID=478 RepID=UPI00081F6849|nr:restriction endonuclease subunit S [Moraxella nonliquefaciens]OBX49572.1 restriction endonuclease [Moraxella nonliquefaciens]
MSKPQNCLLGDLIEFQRGYDLPKSKFVHGKYPVQSSNGILGYHHEYKVKAPSITIGRSGTVGIPHLIKTNFFPHNTALFVKDFKGNDVEYIYYLLKNLKLNEYKTGSGVPTMNRNHLHPLKIQAFLGIPTQKSIAHILSTLDQKIAINNQINAQLEQMAKTLYDYWFVQFDFPDENGKPYKSSGGEMVYNDTLKREIPKGWEVKGLGEIADLYQPQTLSEKDLIEEGKYLVYGANGIIGKYFKYNHNEPVIAIACRGNSCGTINVTQPLSWITGNAMVVKPKLDYMCIDYIKNTLIISNVEKTISGSAQPQITRTNLAPLSFICPSEKLLRAYANKVQAAFELRMKTFEQNQQLTQLRDFLLPMLMNGQMGVGDD